MSSHDLRRQVHQLGLQIAIDGPAGAGKSTVGRALAALLACAYLDTGLMYRAVSWRAMENGLDLDNGKVLADQARAMRFSLSPSPTSNLEVDGRPAPSLLHSPLIDTHVSQVSAHPEVRVVLVECQRQFAALGAIVMVGRDIGTVVLPEAPVKLWVTASPEERARRRVREVDAEQSGSSGKVIADAIRERDARDTGRLVSPLRPAADARTIDTDFLSADQAVALALSVVRTAIDFGRQASR